MAMLIYIKPFFNARNEMILSAKMEDEFGDLDVIMFPSLYKKMAHILYKGVIYIITGRTQINKSNNRKKIYADKIRSLDNIVNIKVMYLKITLLKSEINIKKIKTLFNILKKHKRGNSPIVIYIEDKKKKIIKKCLGKKWRIKISHDVIFDLKNLFYNKNIFIKYR